MLLDASPVTNCHTFSDPSSLERDVLYGRPQGCWIEPTKGEDIGLLLSSAHFIYCPMHMLQHTNAAFPKL